MTYTVWTRSTLQTPWYRTHTGTCLPLAAAKTLASALRASGQEAQVQAEVKLS